MIGQPNHASVRGNLLATSSVVVVIVRNGSSRPPDLSRLCSPDGDRDRPHQTLDALSPSDPYGDTPFYHGPFNQNGSGEINCATEKRRRSAAFEAKCRKALRASAGLLRNFSASGSTIINHSVDLPPRCLRRRPAAAPARSVAAAAPQNTPERRTIRARGPSRQTRQ